METEKPKFRKLLRQENIKDGIHGYSVGKNSLYNGISKVVNQALDGIPFEKRKSIFDTYELWELIK